MDRLRIHASNRLADLVCLLAGELRTHPLPPLVRETIIVPGPGARRWLSQELSRHLGCAADLDLPLAGRFCSDLALRIAGHRPAPAGDQRTDVFAADALAWRLYDRLGSWCTHPTMALLATYWERADQRMRLQLCRRIGRLLEDYQLHRRDWLFAWEAGRTLELGRHEGWQAELWRRLVAELGDDHPARLMENALGALSRSAPPAAGWLPPRLTVLAQGNLPAGLFALLAGCARHIPVTVLHVAPTPHEWTDLRSEREQARSRRRGRAGEASTGNPLLAGLGRQGRDLLALIGGLDDSGQAWEPLDFADPGTGSALAVLQHDVLEVIDRGVDAPPLALAADDRSLSIHSCHSPVRELEVIRDQLLAAFAEIPDLRPGDCAVLVTDLERYAPLARAILSAPRDGITLPVRIADRRRDVAEPAARALLGILRLAGSRLAASEVLDLLEFETVRAAADIAHDEVPRLRDLVADAGVRWGADAAHRASIPGLPAFAERSWEEGLDRLLLALAAGRDEDGWEPGGDTGSNRELAGRLACWFERLRTWLGHLEQPRSLAAWSALLGHLIDDLLAGDDESAVVALRRDGGALDDLATRAGTDSEVGLPAVLDELESLIGAGSSAGFLWGGITVAELRPLRTLPFRVVAVCGLDDGVFPRRTPPSPFDLMAAHHRPGDRRPREDDRQCLLDTLLAVQDRVILTWTGRSRVDNAALPPSVAVAELLDWSDRAFTVDQGRPRDRLVVEHPLQPFSPRYRDGLDPRLVSFSADLTGATLEPRPFLATGLALGADDGVVDLDDLISCWSHPARYVLKQGLDLRLDRDEDPVDDHEAFALGALDAWRLRSGAVRALLAGRDPAELARLAGSLPGLPLGEAGRAAVRTALIDAESLRARIGEPVWLDPIELDLAGDGWRLIGRIDGLTEDGLLAWRAGTAKPSDRLALWIRHLALSVIHQRAGTPARASRLIDRDATYHVVALPQAERLLSLLVSGFRNARGTAIPFWPAVAEALVLRERELAKPTSRVKISAEEMARRAWAEEREDAWNALVWRDRDPFVDRFADILDLARAVWEPLSECLTEADA